MDHRTSPASSTAIERPPQRRSRNFSQLSPFWNAPLLGFNFDPTPVMNKIAALKNVKEEFYPPLMTGTVDPVENLPKANQKFKDAGLDKVMAEMQRQFDAWRAKK